MPTLLKIDVSPRGDQSVSRQLGQKFLASWQAKHTDGTVVTRDLAARQPTFVDLPWIGGAFSSPEQHTPEQKAALTLSDELTKELLAADEVLITTPLYNFSIPSVLKAWIDHVVRPGLTFNPATYQGLVKAKVTIIFAAGGNYEEGHHMEQMNLVTPYLKVIFGFIGVTDLTITPAFQTSSILQGKTTLEQYVAEHPVAA